MDKKRKLLIAKVLKLFNENLLLILVLLGFVLTVGLIISLIHYIVVHHV
jgi:hypothetical protein